MFKKYILLLVLLVPCMVQPFASFYLMEKDGKQVLMLGDAHSFNWNQNALYKMNDEHLRQFIHEILENEFKLQENRYDCFVEIQMSLFEAFKNRINHPQHSKLANTIFGLCCTGMNNNVINFSGFETRNCLLDHVIDDGLEGIASMLNYTSSFVYQSFRKQYLEICDKALIMNKQKTHFTVGEYLTWVKKNYSTIQDLSRKYKGTEFSSIFDEKAKNYLEQAICIIRMFQKLDEKMSVSEALINLFSDCSNKDEALQTYYKLNDLFVVNHSYVLFDLMLLDKIIENQNHKSKAMLVMGHSHCIGITKLLLKAGYTLIKQETIMGDIEYNDFSKSTQFIKNLLMTVKKFVGLEYVCAFCKKPLLKDSLKACSACKAIYYCSSLCQKNDWAFHKNICNCITGKKKLYLITSIELDEHHE